MEGYSQPKVFEVSIETEDWRDVPCTFLPVFGLFLCQ